MPDIIISLWGSWIKIPLLVSVPIFCLYSLFTLPKKYNSAETPSQKISRENHNRIVKRFLVFLLIWSLINLCGVVKLMADIAELDDKSQSPKLFIGEILLMVLMFIISTLLMLFLKISIDKLKRKY